MAGKTARVVVARRVAGGFCGQCGRRRRWGARTGRGVRRRSGTEVGEGGQRRRHNKGHGGTGRRCGQGDVVRTGIMSANGGCVKFGSDNGKLQYLPVEKCDRSQLSTASVTLCC